MELLNRKETMHKRVQQAVSCKIGNFHDFGTENDQAGFSFIVDNELDAYKAVYQYRYCPRTRVLYVSHMKKWSVAIWTTEGSEG